MNLAPPTEARALPSPLRASALAHRLPPLLLPPPARHRFNMAPLSLYWNAHY